MDNKLVIIPTYNEKENIEAIIRKVMSLDGDFEVLVIDDNSPDGTADIVKKLQTEFLDKLHIIGRSGKQGLATAYICGFHWAIENNYDYIFEMDADFSHNPDDLIKLYERAKNGYDVVIGSRYVCGVNVVNWPIGRVIMSYYASVYVRTITGMPVNDSTAGFMCYSRKALEGMGIDKIRMKGYGFQIEMKYRSWKRGFKLSEVSIIFTDRTKGVSKMSSGIFGEAFWGVLALRLRGVK
ncbi:MAG: polyprenol monophosphomannose synthase [Rikenellaceae bacterium]